jgi:hypothetical protein
MLPKLGVLIPRTTFGNQSSAHCRFPAFLI